VQRKTYHSKIKEGFHYKKMSFRRKWKIRRTATMFVSTTKIKSHTIHNNEHLGENGKLL
jgi:hypothetical protein